MDYNGRFGRSSGRKIRARLVAVVTAAARGGMTRADLEQEWDKHTEPARDADGNEDHDAELWVRGIFTEVLNQVYGGTH